MGPFEYDAILFPGFVIFVTTALAVYFVTKSITAVFFASSIKAGAFLVYFGVLFDGTFTYLDDWTYLQGGRLLLTMDIGFTNAFQNFDLVTEVSEGNHFLFYVFNAKAISMFGDGYYAPVAANILITIPLSYLGYILSKREFALTELWARAFFIFILFHPDIFSWSTIANGKDIIVLFLHLCLLYSVSLYFRREFILCLILAVPAFLFLSYLRFYVSLFFCFALVVSQIPLRISELRVFHLLVGLSALSVTYVYIGGGMISDYRAEFISSSGNPLFGLIHFILTPIPFGTSPEYAFLDVPALMHWMMIPLAIVGLSYITKLDSNFGRFFLAYLAIFTLLYAMVPDLRGPRHRVQLDFAWAALQFLGFMKLYSMYTRPHAPIRDWLRE